MKNHHLFYQLNKCTGCQQCVMACSLLLSGKCGVKESHIEVLRHPEFGFAQPIVSDQCQYTRCSGACVTICSLNVLKLIERSQWSEYILKVEWEPVPVFNRKGG